MRNIVTIAIKDLLLLWRDRFGMFWVIVFPVMMATFFGSLMGSMNQQSPIRILVADEDNSELSQAFIKKLGESTAVQIVTLGGKKEEGAEKQGVDVDLARGQVQERNASAYVRIMKGFGETGFIPAAAKVEIGIDPSRRVEAGLLQGVVMEAVYSPIKDMFTNPSSMKKHMASAREQLDKAGDWPIGKEKELVALKTLLSSVDDWAGVLENENFMEGSGMASGKPEVVEVTANEGRPASGYEISFPQSITWGLFGCVSAFAMSVVQERTLGTYLRLRVAPVSKAEILGGKGMACFVSCCIVSIFLLVFGRLAFGVRILDPLKLGVGVVASSLCFVGFMMFASVLGRTERAVAGSVWALIMPMAMLGGSMVPQIAMPEWMIQAGSISPVKWTIQALDGGIWHGISWSALGQTCGVLLLMGAVMYAAGVFILLRYDN
jgi:linearmycin/streptolysin S transport system permease protein